MKKLTKLSLVAAVAVAGFTTSASAVALEEAIKGVDVSGYVRYRFENNNTGTAVPASGYTHGEETHRYTAVVNTSTPMGDFTKANIGVRADATTADNTSDANPSSNGTLGTTVESGDATGLYLATANFSAQIGKTTVIAGKQYLNTPLTHAGWDTGSGILALNSDLPVTLAAGFFANTGSTTINSVSASGQEDAGVTVLAAIGKVAMVDAQLWYFNIADIADAYFVEASTKVANVDLKAQYVNTKYEEALAAFTTANDEHTFTALEVGTTLAKIDVKAAYTATGNEGGAVTIDDGHDDASLISIGEQAQAAGNADYTNYGLSVMAPVVAGLSVGADYVMLDTNSANVDATEIVLRAAYKVDKKFGLEAFYSTMDVDNASEDSKQTRVEAKYKF